MLFGSCIFIFIFLPCCWCGYFLLNRRGAVWGQTWLLLSSLLFYGYFMPQYLLILGASIPINYGFGQLLHRCRSRLLLAAGLIFNLGLLGYFKYYDFFIECLNWLLGTSRPLHHILLPLGISFFTFQQIGYLCDIAAGRLTARCSLRTYALFVSFFPQLIAGPIVLPGEMLPQFQDREKLRPQAENIAAGLFIFILGLAKKLLLADNFAPFCDLVYALPDPTLPEVLAGTLSYVLQLYFDFSGYCDMAIGLGLLFNITLPVNFRSPYRSPNIREFWRNWHITLGRFLTQYLYFPLGGSRCGELRTMVNLLLTFAVSGLWHGAGLNWICWGVLNGIAIIIHRIWSRHLGLSMPKAAGIALNFLFCWSCFALFRGENWEQIRRVYAGAFRWTDAGLERFLDNFSTNDLLLMLLGLVICFCLPPVCRIAEKFTPNRLNLAAALILLLLSVFMLNRVSPFIYFNF